MWIKRSIALAGLTMALLQGSASCARCDIGPWQDWHAFQRDLIQPDGRVLDASDDRQITTSEGQSYALFFALVDNDRMLFRRLLRWTERHLAKGDLTAHLPAWLWGRQPSGQWGVLDDNSASDANLWIAYTLLEAGRLWKEHSYTVLGSMMLRRIAKDEVKAVAPFGLALIPGQRGFLTETSARLNPSYVPLQLLARADQALPDSIWAPMLENTVDFLIETAPLGLAPDWVDLHHGEVELTKEGRVGSYNAIRVYLWTGMLHDETVGARRLKAHFRQAARYLDVDGVPAEQVDILDGRASTQGPVGFSAAVLPLFQDTDFGHKQRLRLGSGLSSQTGYYSRVLHLFGTGWDARRFEFDAKGYVLPAWRRCR